MTQVRKKRSAKLDFWVQGSVTYHTDNHDAECHTPEPMYPPRL